MKGSYFSLADSYYRLSGHRHQVYANPDDSLSLSIGWNPPTETNGAEILAYIVELVSSSAGWSTPYFNVTLSVEDAAEMASSVSAGGTWPVVSTPYLCNYDTLYSAKTLYRVWVLCMIFPWK